ncbi:MAG: hypothetical protein ACK47B_28195 [Armatimonadota bacterium]
MAIIQGLLAVIARSAGKLLNTVFGWATTLLFGKVSEDRQIYLSIMSFGSVAWLVVAIGVIFPSVGTFLLAFVPLPEWVNDNWVRLIMLAAALLIPLLVGGIALKLLEPDQRPEDAAGKAKVILKGYPYTLGIAVTLVLMTLFAPLLKLPALARRWETQHVPVVVDSDQYCSTLEQVERALEETGWQLRRGPASWMLRLPTRVLTALAGGAIENMVARQLTTLRSDNLEVTLHPSDLVVSGKEAEVAHARAVVAEQLAFAPAYMTWTREANGLEDQLDALWRENRDRPAAGEDRRALERLHQIEEALKGLRISYEEWEVLTRQKLLLERSILRSLAGITDRPESPDRRGREPERAPAAEITQRAERPVPSQGVRRETGGGLRAGVAALLASAAWIWHRRNRSRGR